MKVQESSSGIYRFGAFVADPASGELRKQGVRVKIQEQPFRLLLALLERAGEVVTREELQRRLWTENTFVEFDASLRVAVGKLREALGDNSDAPRYLETVPRRGYRFVGPVSREDKPVELRAPATRRRVGPAVVAGVVLLGLIAGLGVWRLRGRWRSIPAANPIRSLAVLPLRNLSGDPGQEYFVDGITEELIGRLSQIRGVRVISRTSAMRFKETKQPIPEIARALNVDAIVEGSVIREGSRVRVTVQLIRGATGDHIWAEDYDRELRSILVVQEEVAQTIARQIRVTLAPQEQAARDVDPQAHEDYLKGRYYANQRTEKALNRSVEFFQQALARDQNYAPAYAGMADAYALLGFRSGFPSQEALERAKTAALKAIELDDSLADPHVSLAFLAETHEWDWKTAEREYQRALQLNPGYALAHDWYAGYLMYVGRLDEGIAEARRARELDPLSLPINNALAGRLLVAGRYQEAQDQLRETLEMDPHYAPTHQTLGWLYLNTGKREQAVQEFQQALQLSGTAEKDFLLDLGFAYAVTGRQKEARNILRQLEQMRLQGIVNSAYLAILEGALGEMDQGFAWLEKAYQERDPELTYLKVRGRRFDPLRRDPRFAAMVQRVGLPR